MLEKAALLARRMLILGPAAQRTDIFPRGAEEIGGFYPDAPKLRREDNPFYINDKDNAAYVQGGIYGEFCDMTRDAIDADAWEFVQKNFKERSVNSVKQLWQDMTQKMFPSHKGAMSLLLEAARFNEWVQGGAGHPGPLTFDTACPLSVREYNVL